MNPASVPGSRLFQWVKLPVLRISVLTGVYLSTVLIIWLLLANRVAFLDNFAQARNAVSLALFALVMLIPIGAFLRTSAAKVFASGALGWLLFAGTYWAMGFFFFERLHSRFRRPLNVFVMGLALYGIAAVALWVFSMARHARTHAIASSRPRPY